MEDRQKEWAEFPFLSHPPSMSDTPPHRSCPHPHPRATRSSRGGGGGGGRERAGPWREGGPGTSVEQTTSPSTHAATPARSQHTHTHTYTRTHAQGEPQDEHRRDLVTTTVLSSYVYGSCVVQCLSLGDDVKLLWKYSLISCDIYYPPLRVFECRVVCVTEVD